MDTILKTKFYFPQPASGPIQRPIIARIHLLQKLDMARHSKFTLISAPTGFGKTTLVAGWLSQLTGATPRWLSLDKSDNVVNRFIIYFVHALRGIDGDMGNLALGASALLALQTTTTPAIETVLTAVLNDIAQIDQPIILVLDDFHLITEPQVHEIVQFVLHHQPAMLHLLLISRADPPWPLARWRARGDMVELRSDDLRFTPAETALFLNDAMGFGLSQSQIKALYARLEGWIAGLQMAALSLRKRQDVASFIQGFSGSQRFISDYLIEEVLQQQSATIQQFLLKSSVLGRLCGSLCDAVLERDDSQEVLAKLDRANLFLVPLDDSRRWYRYHHLFAEMLLTRLRQTQPETLRPLQIKASEWAEANRLMDEAVDYALTAVDYERVARIISENGLTMAYHGELKTLLNWLEALPDKMVQKRPWLNVAYAWALAFSGQLDAAELQLQTAAQLVAEMPDPQHLVGYITLVYAYCAGIRNDETEISKLAESALRHLPEKDGVARGMATLLLAIGQRIAGNLTAATPLFVEALNISQATRDHHLMVDVLWERAVLEFRLGHLRQVMATCQSALQLAHTYKTQNGRLLPVQGYIYERMSSILLEQNELTAALHYAQEGYELGQQWGQADAVIVNSLGLAMVLLAMGDDQEALALIEEVQDIAAGLSAWYDLTVGAMKTQIWLAQGKIATAVCWLEESGLRYDDHIHALYHTIYLRIARILFAQGKLHELFALLARLLAGAEATGAMHSVICSLVLQAIAFQAQGDRASAVTSLAQALTLAEPEGYMRTFINEGAAMVPLLRQTAVAGHSVTYVGQLLTALEQDIVKNASSSLLSVSQSASFESFSQRELQVLHLLATPLSSVEMAKELMIAPSTVRSHIKSIYRKLDVHKRVTAVQRAQVLGLL